MVFAFGIFSDVTVFLLIMIFVAIVIGMFSRSAVHTAFCGFLVFAHIGINTTVWIFEPLLIVITVGITGLMGFRGYQYFTQNQSQPEPS